MDRLTASGRRARQAKKFNAEVDALIRARRESGNMNLGKPKRTTLLSPDSLKKVSNRKVDRFGSDLYKYKSKGSKEVKFPGISGNPKRTLSPKALSKVSQRKIDKFDRRKLPS